MAEIIGLAQTYVTYTIIDGTREYEAVRVAAMAEKQFSAANGAIIGELGLILAELLPRLSLRKS